MGVGRGAKERPQAAKWGIPGAGGVGGGRDRWGEQREQAPGQEERALAGPFQGGYLPHLSPQLWRGSGDWGG